MIVRFISEDKKFLIIKKQERKKELMIRLKIESSFLYVYFIILSQKSYHRIYKSCKNSERQFTVNFIRIRSKENILPYHSR